MTETSIPRSFDLLLRMLGTESSPDDLLVALRALQRGGLSKLEFVAFIETARERNSLAERDELFEENCLLALDMVHGWTRKELSLIWAPE